ncbi:NADH-quinone oxidoreductase subunit A [Ferroacidibacillus organovorans]|uniref:NADH-quinone oxidoreductase subunit A n=1 Tax=Ferroacidibacillus organovorans TaxID=1765683 RepID=A0A170MYA5_9BACL|nr:NADH-quinone oxidoreductase subunit A [Ferroacidibacillus organovorans]KYP81465.1 NADH:ubiquinone oxidoreductase subunit A [Ferroacidibacillus organovorans]OAG93991.1 NADH:ubiquinone oxidoreductase subunit A [Ferroacidibacillus organovorans]OPG16720.1 NADH:ubiquinone oxidoreductase subunit A [Ferroacidibacillus organovorans]
MAEESYLARFLDTCRYGGIRLYANAFIFLLVFLVLAIALPIGALAVLGPLLRPSKPSKAKNATYESGLEPIGDARSRYNVRYYLFALMFVIFDVEIIFLYPWAVSYHTLGVFGYVEMMIFVVLLLIGLMYAWRKKVLEWM